MPSEWLPFMLFALSALPHAPFAIRLHCTIGVSERTRDIWRACDIFFIFTCGGVLLTSTDPLKRESVAFCQLPCAFSCSTDALQLVCAEIRALSLAWYVFNNAKSYALFAAATATVYCHCLQGMNARGLKNLTKPPFIRVSPRQSHKVCDTMSAVHSY